MHLKKKGEGSVIWIIVGVILLLVGFALLLWFFYHAISTTDIDNQVCHESVIFRATLPGATKGYVPLKCATQKYCITDKLIGSADCSEDFGDITKYNTVRIRNTNQLEKFYADNTLSCWNMMGEGKVSLFYQGAQSFGVGKDIYPSCVICSRIAFDKTFSQKLLNEMNLVFFMSTQLAPGSEKTYSQLLSNGADFTSIGDNLKSSETLDEFIEALEKATGDKPSIDLDKPLDNGQNNIRNENAILFMQITSPDQKESISNIFKAAGIGIGASYIVAPATTIAASAKFVSGGWLTLATLAIFGVYQQGSVANNRAIAAGYCSDLLTGKGARNGCSAVRTVNYDAESISSYCLNVESIP